jgi:hypothetical protein
MTNPYRGNAPRTFWRSAVAEKHIADFTDMWDPLPLQRADRVATAGSCFAQHIGRNLKIRGADYMDMEPAPPIFSSENEARRFGFGVFSCRYGNVYTSRQLLQLIEEAFGHRTPAELVWEKDGRFFDAMRPGIDPVGEASAADVLAARALHLAAVREMFENLDLLVFTMGLTEGWESVADGTMFPTAPGTIAGSYHPARYAFRNLRHGEILVDMQAFWARLKAVNPKARMLLTISPVPLVATATGDHVLSATTYSKSVLRGVAGDLAADHSDIHYFPSYEIISGHPSRGIFFNPDLRNVNEFGVNLVMTHFFSGTLAKEFGTVPQTEEEDE